MLSTFGNLVARCVGRRGLSILAGAALLLAAPGGMAGEVVRVGAYDNPPKCFIAQDGNPTGIFPELLNKVGGDRGWEIQYVFGTWTECLTRLEQGEIDLMIDVAFSKKRAERFAFAEESVLTSWGTVYARKNLPIETFQDLENRTVAVMRGSIHTDGTRGIKALMSAFDVPCRFVEVDSYQQVLMVVDSGAADAGVVNRMFGALHGDEYDLMHTPIVFNPRSLFFTAPRGSEKGQRLLDGIDASLTALKHDPQSVYHKILTYYLGSGSHRWDRQAATLAVDKLNLGATERAWIADHSPVRFSIDPGFAPFESYDKEGKYRGMAADYLELITRMTGIRFEAVKRSTWAESVQAIKAKEIDLLPCVGVSEERKSFLTYTHPYLKFSRVIITPMESVVTGLEDLSDLRIGVQDNSSHHGFLEEATDLKPQLYDTFEEAMLAVSRGEIDATIGNLAVSTHVMQELALTNIKMAAYAAEQPQALCLGVRKDWPELAAILNLALDAITPRQRNGVLREWLPLPSAASSGLELDQDEREWLLMHPRIRVAWDRGWAPIEFADENGLPQGISIGYLRALRQLLGVHFDMGAEQDATWQDTYAKLRQGELDMCSCLAVTPERLEHLDFTDPYLDVPVVIFGGKGIPYIDNMAELHGLRVAVVKGYATDEWLQRDHVDLQLRQTASIAEAFRLLQKRKADVFVGCVLPGNYYLSNLRHHDIRIVGETPYSYKLNMAVRKDWPIFGRILKKALRQLPKEETNSIYRKWVWLRYEHGFDYTFFGQILMGALVVILLFVYWNRRLASAIKERKNAEAALARSEQELRVSYTNLKEAEELKENLTHMIVHDMRAPLTIIAGSQDLLELHAETQELDGNIIRQNLKRARRGTRTLASMVQGLLDIGRLEAGQMELNLKTVDLYAIAHRSIDAMRPQAGDASIHLRCEGATAMGEMDAEIVERVLVNLVGNAIDASPKKASVCVKVSDTGDHVVAAVCDTGKGIPKECRDQIFEKFASAEKGAHRKHTSVGLGLAFCKLAIEAHGGQISVESADGCGSTFRFELPKTNPNAVKPAAASAVSS